MPPTTRTTCADVEKAHPGRHSSASCELPFHLLEDGPEVAKSVLLLLAIGLCQMLQSSLLAEQLLEEHRAIARPQGPPREAGHAEWPARGV